MRRVLPWVLTTCVLGLLLAPLAHPGILATRDMLVPARLPLTHVMLVLVGPARALPQDFVLSIFSWLYDASIITRLLLVGVGLCVGVFLCRVAGPLAAVAALASPFVILRLAQGHWSLVLAAWLLPYLVLARGQDTRWRLAVMVAALSPSGAVLTGIPAILARPRQWWFVVLTWLPWLVPSLLSPAATTSHTGVFAARSLLGPDLWQRLLSAATGAGLWNAQISGHWPQALFYALGLGSVLLVAGSARRIPLRWLLLGATGLVGQLLPLWELPFAGLLRDSQKLSLWWWLLIVLALASLPPKFIGRTPGAGRTHLDLANSRTAHTRISRYGRAYTSRTHYGLVNYALAIAAALALLLPAQPTLKELTPLPAPPAIAAPGRAFHPDWTTIATYHGRTVVNPYSKQLDLLLDDSLTVSGEVVDAPNPTWVRAQEILAAAHKNPDELSGAHRAELYSLGIDTLITGPSTDPTITPLGPARPLPRTPIVLLALWLAAALVATAHPGLHTCYRRARSKMARNCSPVDSQENSRARR